MTVDVWTDPDLAYLYRENPELLAIADTVVDAAHARTRPEIGDSNANPSGARVRPRRRRLLISVAAVVLVTALAAVAFGSRLGDFFEGAPATPEVQRAYVTFNGSLTPEIQAKFAVHPVDLSQIHGVIAVQTSEGPVYLWSAPEGDGGACFLVEYGSGGIGTPAEGCSPEASPNPSGASPGPSNILPGAYWTASHPFLRIVYGYTYGDATSVAVDLADGSVVRLPVAEHYFLAAVNAAIRIKLVTSYDEQGHQIGEALLTS